MAPNRPIHTALAPGHFLFTSESVGEGHPGTCNFSEIGLFVGLKDTPDKICDQVSDAIVSRPKCNGVFLDLNEL
jgi:S-adenosylmethionine synthetase